MAFKVITEFRGDAAIARLSGKFTVTSEIDIRQLVLDLINQGAKRVILDLTKVDHIDSSGIGELVAAYTGAANAGAKLTLVGLSGVARNQLTANKLITIFDSYPTVDEALAAG